MSHVSEKIIIFDFDGVIANSLFSAVKIYNELAKEHGFGTINSYAIRGLSNQEALKKLGVPFYKLPSLVKEIRQRLSREIPAMKAYKGIKEILAHLKEYSCQLGIITSNSKENVKEFLKNNNLEFFDFFYSGTSLFGKDKKLKRFIHTNKIDPGRIIYVGDEVRDIEAAKKTGVVSAAVTWGISTKEMLEKQNPDFIIEKPEELIKILV